MTEQLDAVLNLDYSEALGNIRDLREQIDEIFTDVGLTVDKSALDDLSGTPVEIPVETDTAPVIGEISAIPDAAPDVNIPVEADTGPAQAEIGQLEGQQTILLPVDLDTSSAESQLALFEGGVGTGIDIPVTVDTGDADAEVDSLTETLTGTEGASAGAASGLEGVSTAATTLGATSSFAQGKLGGLSNVSQIFGSTSAKAAAGPVALGAAIGTLFTAGTKAVFPAERLNVVFGSMSGQVQKINVGGLNGDLGELAVKAGSSGGALKNAVANLGEFAITSGKSKQEAAAFTEQVSALSLRAVALRPDLGDAGEVADRLGLALARGGRAAQRFGVDLRPAEINARALKDTGKNLTSELTQTEKAMAGASIAVEKLGPQLGKDFSRGVDQASVQLKRLQREIGSALATAGAPLVEPLIDALERLEPAIVATSKALGQLGQATLPLIQATASTASFALGGLGAVFDLIPSPVLTGIVALEGLSLALNKTLLGATKIGGAVEPLVSGLASVKTVAGIAAVGIGAAGVASGDTTQAFLGLGVGAGLLASSLGAGALAATGIGAAVGVAAVIITNLATSSDQAGEAQERLNKRVTGGTIPAIQRATRGLADAVGVTDKYRLTNAELTGTISAAEDAHRRHAIAVDFDKGLTEAFNKSLDNSVESAMTTISAWQGMGIATEKYQLQLQTTIGVQEAAKSSIAATQVAASPLRATFEQAATALGETSLRTFDAINAIGAMTDADSKAEQAHAAFGKAVESGNETQVRAAAAATATAESQKAFADAIAQGKTAQEAGTAGLSAYRQTLVDLGNQFPAIKPQLDDLIATLDARIAEPKQIKVDLDDSAALVKASALQRVVEQFVSGKPIDLKILARGFPEAQAQIDNIRAHKDELESKPAVMQAILQDLASGNLADIDAQIATLDGQEAKPTVSTDTFTAGQQLQNIQNQLDNLKGTGATVVVNADGGPAEATLFGLKTSVDTTTGTMTISGNPALANQATTGAKVYADTATGTITIGGNNAPAGAVLVGTIATVDGSTGTIVVDGNPQPANQKTDSAVDHANSSKGTVKIDGDDSDVRSKGGDRGVIGRATIQIASQFVGQLFAQGGVVQKAAAGLKGTSSPFTVVGERGRELAAFPQGTRVFSHRDTEDMLRNVGGIDPALSSALGSVASSLDSVARGLATTGGTQVLIVSWDQAVRAVPALARMDPAFLQGRGS